MSVQSSPQIISISDSSLKIESFEIGPFPNNLYLVLDETAREFVVIDPSIESEIAITRAQELIGAGYALRAIWNTHGHVDHVHDNALWKTTFDVPIGMHQSDDFLLEHLHEQSIWLGLPPARPVGADFRFEDGQSAHVGAHAARVLHVPGHSPGSVAFHFQGASVVISGDVLFRGSIGRTDLPGCNNAQMQASLRRLAGLPPATRVLSGHGADTTIEHELRSNPFLKDLKATI